MMIGKLFRTLAAPMLLCGLFVQATAQDVRPPGANSPVQEPAAPTAPQRGEKPAETADPNDPELRDRLLKELYSKLATAPDKDASKQYVTAIQRLWSKSTSDTIDLLMARSQVAVGKRNMDLAFKLLGAATDLEPTYAEAWNQRAFLHFTQKNYEEALDDLQRVLAIDPNHFKAIDGVYTLMRQFDDKKSALAAMRILKKVYPHWPGGKGEAELSRQVEGQPISFEQ